MLHAPRPIEPAQLWPHSSQTTAPDEPTVFVTAANVLHDLHSALHTMQDQYFALWLGKWTTAIDWTAAVMGTYISATLSSISHSIDYTLPGTFDKTIELDVEAQRIENEINKYFGQSVAFYYGEEAFAIRMQAYDDMLWVVLGWLEGVKFIEEHGSRHYGTEGAWHAQQFLPAFAHRARVFYELAEQGWDWKLCGGGMTWNPRLLPYKNAITNQLFISASISMYLHFLGDSNCSPYLLSDCPNDGPPGGRYNPRFLANAINGYEWLQHSGMLNAQGLYTDGFHIAGYRQNHSKTVCDERNEMVYTYNQGVVLSGLRNLWEATGNISYLEDGHELVRNVLAATGWRAGDNEWHGLGSHGILIEACDPSGTCSQDGQTFKGIFFHHLTAFCTPLPRQPTKPGRTVAASREVAMLHHKSCESYTSWVVHNAHAALCTRDKNGLFGGWWGADPGTNTEIKRSTNEFPPLPQGAIDYRNYPTDLRELDIDPNRLPGANNFETRQRVAATAEDPNDRGRGRTVETQGSGLAVVRAMYEFLRRNES
jgi:hypothetical protein